jgi:RimJ/RimL family protein N-acetyltransferase
MTLAETDLIIDYFHDSSPEHLDMLGVDPSRLPSRADWHDRFVREKRVGAYVVWLCGDEPVGISTCNKIVYGERANMHLHVIKPERRNQGVGAECVKQSIEIYFATLKLKSLYCEPNAFNVGPNRTLQKAGFKYLKTYMTVPGPLNYHQAVTCWMIER